MSQHEAREASLPGGDEDRRRFVSASGVLMAAGLVGGYGALAAMFGRFVFPSRSANRGWLFVCQVDQLPPGAAMDFATPSGQRIVIARDLLRTHERTLGAVVHGV